MNRPTYEEVTETATEAKSTWAGRDILRFHYFNPNGLVARKAKQDRRCAILVHAGFLPSGWLFTSGSLYHYHEDGLREHLDKRRVSYRAIRYHIEALEKHLVDNDEKLTWAEDEFMDGKEYDHDAMSAKFYPDVVKRRSEESA